MDLPDFVKSVKRDLKTFERWWQKHQRQDPDAYPAEMDADDWAEALVGYIEGDNEDDDADDDEDDDGARDGVEDLFDTSGW